MLLQPYQWLGQGDKKEETREMDNGARDACLEPQVCFFMLSLYFVSDLLFYSDEKWLPAAPTLTPPS